jgi:hypothetical protein
MDVQEPPRRLWDVHSVADCPVGVARFIHNGGHEKGTRADLHGPEEYRVFIAPTAAKWFVRTWS